MRIPIPIIGGAYKGRSSTLSPQRCINFFPVFGADGDKAPMALMQTPGLSEWADVGTAQIRAMIVLGANLHVLGGNTLYTYDTAAAKTTNSGTVGNTTGVAFLAHDGTNLMVVDPGDDGYTLSGTTLSVIADGDFPTPSCLTWQDGYFIVSKDASGQFFISSSYDPTAWDATDYKTAEAKPDNLVSIFSHRRQLWLFGGQTTEVWYNSGAADFPFDPISGALLPFGCAAAGSVAMGDNALFWLSESENGTIQVLRADGFTPRAISTPQIDYQIASYSSISDAIGYVYAMEGHIFYVLNFPTGDATWVYDALTGEWHERQSYPVNADGTYSRHRGNAYAYFNGKHLVGDHANGKIWELDLDKYDDVLGNMISQRDTGPVTNKGKYIFFRSLEIDFEGGVGSSPGTDKVLNGGFASATTNWTAVTATLSSESGGKSGNCLKLLENGGENPQARQTISVIEGRTYELFAYAKEGDEATYLVQIYDVTNSAEIDSDTGEADATWDTEINISFTAPTDCEQINLNLKQVCANGAGTYILFDSVALYDTEGVAPEVMLQWSDDGGNSWSNEKTREIGASGEYSKRARFVKLGRARERVFRIKVSDPVKRVITGAYADIELGAT